MNIRIKRLSNKATIPLRAHKGDCGLDLFSAEEKTIFPNERVLIKTDIAMQIPAGYYGRICDRSGLALKNGITIFGGQIDEIFTGNVGVILFNSDVNLFQVAVGDKIAQMVIEKYYDFPIVEVNALDETERSDRGFGSTDSVKKVL